MPEPTAAIIEGAGLTLCVMKFVISPRDIYDLGVLEVLFVLFLPNVT